MNYFENLKIERIILHKIFKRDMNGVVPPIYNNKCEDMDSVEKATIEDRIVNAVGSQSKAIEMDFVKTGEESVYAVISDLFRSDVTDEEFVEASRRVTDKLVEAQNTRRMPGGVVVVLMGKTGISENRFVGIIKAEEDNGFTLQTDNGEMSLKYIKDLLLTKNQKIYKVAMLIEREKHEGNITPENIRVFIYDNNNNVAKLESKVTYFYDSFMGCAFQQSSEILTKNFYYYTKEFVRVNKNLDTEMKIGIINGLYTYLKYEVKPIISIREFADLYMGKEEIKDLYFKFMQEKEVPSYGIRKNLKLLTTTLKKRKFKFTHSITLEVPEEEFARYVKIEEKDGNTVITMNAKMMSEA